MAKRTRERLNTAPLRNRILELRQVPAAELRANPANFRRHPEHQQRVLSDLLAEVGIANAVIAYHSADAGGALTLVDGHLRTDVAPDSVWPVLVLDVDDAEAAKLLATMDPLSALAQTDADALDALLREVDTESAAVTQMLADLAEEGMGARLAPPDRERSAALEDALRSGGMAKLVIAGADLRTLEEALAATRRDNRAEALAAICRAYLEHRAAEG